MNRKYLGLIVLAVGLTGLAVWVYGFPAGFQSCNSPDRTLYVDYLTEQGYSVECRKEGDVSGFLKFRMQLFNQFYEWTKTYSVAVIYEQPGYFWFTIPAGTRGAEGFVFYEYR